MAKAAALGVAVFAFLVPSIVADIPLTPHEIEIVQASWKTVEGAFTHEQVGVLFYKQFFKVASETLPKFPFHNDPDIYNSSGLKHQGTGVVDFIATGVQNLKDLSPVVPAVKALGVRHAGRGIMKAMYGKVWIALEATLGAGLGTSWTKELSTAWHKFIVIVADTMYAAQQAAEPDGNHGEFCETCGHQYYPDADGAGKSFDMLPDDWVCPVCGQSKSQYEKKLTEDSLVVV